MPWRSTISAPSSLKARRRRDVLMGMRLRAAAHANAGRAGALAADHERRAAVGHRAAIQQLQRHRHRLRRHHVGDGDRLVELRAGMGQRVGAHQHREFGEVFLGHAVFVHVARGDEAVIGRDRRPQRHLVIGMADLRQRLDRGVAALPGEPVLAADHQHMLRDAGIDQMMRQHGHGEPGGAADLHGVGIGRLDAEMLGEHGRQHDVRRDRASSRRECRRSRERFSPASAIASSAALLMRSSEDEPSCLP